MQRAQRRSTKVCTRCRQRKTRCDFKFPQCTPCILASSACMGYDPSTKQAVPRSLVRSLEARVAQLEAQLLAHQSAPSTLPVTMASITARAAASFGVPGAGPYLQSKLSSGLFLRPSCLPLAVSPPDRGDSDEQFDHGSSYVKRQVQHTSHTSAPMNLANVPRSALERMIRNYTDTHLPQYPILEASLIERVVEIMAGENQGDSVLQQDTHASSPQNLGHFEQFAGYITLAISASTLTWRAEAQARQASEAFYMSAIEHLRLLESYSSIQELQISLLLAHYAHMCPEMVDNWTCISNAVRIVMSLGLYLEIPIGIDRDQAKLRSELFWVTYGMERSLCTNLRLPLSFPEHAITVKMPDLVLDDHSRNEDIKKSSANHIYRYRQLETEVHRVLYLREELTQFGFSSIEDWSWDLMSRLDAWYSEAHTYTPYNMLEFKHVQYYHLKARIYRPTPLLKVRTPQAWRVVLDASRMLIDDYLGQLHRRRLFYPWHGVHILFEAGSISLDAVWNARACPSLVEEARAMLKTHLPHCLLLLENIGNRWNQAIECANKLRPLLEKVRLALSQPQYSVDDAMITEEVNALLFSISPMCSRVGDGAKGFDVDAHYLPSDNLLGEEIGLLPPALDWDIMPEWPAIPNELIDQNSYG